ncbi:LysR family transcriptional regulator [Roseomonas eburnea]|uniref:LysR family transcriptional regulator n=1 Tax=Neoroseomonas eburnea TaxID=1346889 RepID=A0A9X9X8H6_9PROT|nr:LysR family transcriptional regulator [Neoroseomonas eburnea]MBR0680012.1 LysR family transcriptional regulator [Neoroseomonas eburnea]
MELRQLRLFRRVIDEGSFSRAAARLGVTQPALSRAIRALEEELGTSLLYRNGRGVTLTEDGQRFAEELAPMLEGLEALRSRTLAARGIPRGRVSLAMPPSVAALLAPALLRHLQAESPEVELHLLDGFTGTLHEWLTAGRVDIAVLNTHRRSAVLRTEPLFDAHLHLAYPPGDPVVLPLLDAAGEIALADVAALPLLLPGRHHGMRREFEAALAAQDLAARKVTDVDSLAALLSLLDGRLGYGILAWDAMARELRAGLLAAARIRAPELLHGFVVATSADRQISTAAHAVIRFLRAEVRRLAAAGTLKGRVPGT